MDFLVQSGESLKVVTCYFDSKFVGHAIATEIYQCIHESVKEILRYRKTSRQLPMDGNCSIYEFKETKK